MINNTKFNRDTVSNATNIQPLLIVNKEVMQGSIQKFFSTNGLEFEGNYYSPLVLSLPTIKESIDIENRKYKISTSSITLSNLETKGKKLSDSFNILLYSEIDIYFKTQSCVTLSDCLHVFKGKISRVTYNFDTVTLAVEDLTQQKIHKDLPKNIVPEENHKSKYSNKPYPMVIGRVDRSPCVVSYQKDEDYDIDGDGELDIHTMVKSVIADKVRLSKIVSTPITVGDLTINSTPLYVYHEDGYLGISSRTSNDIDQGFTGEINYVNRGDETGWQFVSTIGLDEDGNTEFLNDTSANKGSVFVRREITSIESVVITRGEEVEDLPEATFKSGIIDDNSEFVEDQYTNLMVAADGETNTCVKIGGGHVNGFWSPNVPYNFQKLCQIGLLKYNLKQLSSGLEFGDNDWQKAIAKIENDSRISKEFTSTSTHYDQGQLTTYDESLYAYVPIVSVFTGLGDVKLHYSDRWSDLQGIPTTTYIYGEAGQGIIDTLDDGTSDSPIDISFNENDDNKEHIATSKSISNSMDGDDTVARVDEHVVPLDSTSFYVGTPYIRYAGAVPTNDIGNNDYIQMNDREMNGYILPDVDIKIFGVDIWASAKIDKLLEKDFYADVWGRPSDRAWIENFRSTQALSLYLTTIKDFFNGENLSYNTWYDVQELKDAGSEYMDYISQGDRILSVSQFYFKVWTSDFVEFGKIYVNGEFISEDVSMFDFDQDAVVYFSGNYDLGLFPLTTHDPYKDYTYTNAPLERPSEIVKHILIEECDYNGTFNENDFGKVSDLHHNWIFGFTQNKKINSKKLIEDFSKSTKSFPRFRLDGAFGWVSVLDTYIPANVNLTINSSDILSYKLDRTKIENVKTSVKVTYSKDYQEDSYSLSTDEISVNDIVVNDEGTYDYSYYTLPDDNSDSTLNFESDYIRNPNTANRLRDWLLSWNMNQHNLIDVTLPLKYLKLEIGDVIEFDSHIENMLIYGERYVVEYDNDGQIIPIYRNSQEIYPYFMVYEVNKSTDKVGLKLIQLHRHNLNRFPTYYNDVLFYEAYIPPSTPEGDTYGCTNPDAVNYNPDATIEDGSCEYDSDGDGIYDSDEIHGCTNPNACNYNPDAEIDDGSCTYPADGYICDGEKYGCTIPGACNLDPEADVDDGSCEFHGHWIIDGEPVFDENTYTAGDGGTIWEVIDDLQEQYDGYVFPTDVFNCSGELLPEEAIGDVNFDANVDVLDIVTIVNGILNPPLTPEQSFQADINSDGNVDVLDIVLIVTIILEG